MLLLLRPSNLCIKNSREANTVALNKDYRLSKPTQSKG